MEGILMTVRIEYMIVTGNGTVSQNWTTCEGSIQNDAQIYFPRAYNAKYRFESNGHKTRIRVIDEQTNRIVDMLP
jgi:hypothetical protein